MKISKLIIAFSTVLLLGSNSVFSDGAQPWHLSYQIGGANLDNDRDTRDGDIWNSFGVGVFINHNFSVDFEYDVFEADYDDYNVVVPGATYDSWKLSTYGLMGRYFIGDNAWRPYVGLGLTSTKHRSVLLCNEKPRFGGAFFEMGQ